MKKFIEKNFSATIITFSLLGFIIPGIQNIPDQVVLWLLGVLIFLSSIDIKISDIKRSNLKNAILFYVVRFLIFPLLMFYIASLTIPMLKEGILLLCLMPVGTAAPSLTKLIHGNVTSSLSLVVLSGFLAPFVVPAVFAALGYAGINMDPVQMFLTMAYIIFIPLTLWFAWGRKSKIIHKTVMDHGKFISILSIGLILAIVIAKKRHLMLAEPFLMLICLLVVCTIFLLYFLIGWFWPHKNDHEARLTNTISSGIANNALGISLGLLYFSEETALLMVLSEVPWVLYIPALNLFLAKKRKSKTL